MKKPFLREYRNRNLLMEILAQQIADELKVCLEKKSSVTLAVPGGTTPKLLFNQLSLMDLEWCRVAVIPTDERLVPETSIRSNLGLIRANLLKKRAIEARLISFFEPGYKAHELSIHISEKLTGILPIDVCILGMGSDMHTASIFPGSDRIKDALDLDTPQTIVPIVAPAVDETRLTLTARVLREAPNIHILLTGLDKRKALDVALETSENWEVAPIRSVLDSQNTVTIHYAN